ncbi:diacylglycerol kinase family protein [Thermotoga sp. KOL6]|uniref:diacylglycerol kinase family protein n=1 Tax=Thermotoga sp. KOL6 TaxID=126741 RepID=UPI000C77B7F6|nr:diacylglycerol kinase family protein [Thermotoga sp. KOL6]PLV59137.1 diacylglycerol kinase [Thermotoga sp. KOL6]
MRRDSNNILNSFKNAFRGIEEALKLERNLKIHFFIGIAIAMFSLFLPLDSKDLLWLYFAVFSVIGAELLNTVVEKFLDLFFEDYSESVRLVKDIAAGLVLWYSLFSIVVGILILGKNLFSWPPSIAKFFVSGVLIFFPVLSLIMRRYKKYDRQTNKSSSGG